MDIRSKAVAETGVLHLNDANDKPMYDGEGDQKKRVTVTLYSPGSKQYAEAKAWLNNRWATMIANKAKNPKTVEEDILEDAEFLAMCTKGWDGVEMDGLTGFELSKAIYAETTIGFVRTQVKNFLGDWGNFTKGSAKT